MLDIWSGWKTKLDTSISYAMRGLVIVVYTLRGDLLCNRFFENSPVFGKPQRISVRCSLMCVSFRNFYILQERCCCHLDWPYWFSGQSVIFDYFYFWTFIVEFVLDAETFVLMLHSCKL